MLILKKHGNLLIKEQKKTLKAWHEGLFSLKNPSDTSFHRQYNQVESRLGCEQYGTQTDMFSRVTKRRVQVSNIHDPSIRESRLLDIFIDSVTSLSNSMNDLHLPLDISNASFGSLDSSYSSDASRSKVANGSNLILAKDNDYSYECHSYTNMNQKDLKFMSGLAKLPWDSQCKIGVRKLILDF
ncbi:hypothetical protein OIU76_002271 [Salix suchowensis]|nr:hypothetical protein OIU76_002271 [Salix suchowensis]